MELASAIPCARPRKLVVFWTVPEAHDYAYGRGTSDGETFTVAFLDDSPSAASHVVSAATGKAITTSITT